MMITYAQLNETKTFLWITTSTKDAVLLDLLKSTTSIINRLLRVTSLNYWTFTETIPLKHIYSDWVLYLKNSNVSWITKINWKDYTWILWEDYQITYWRKIEINDISKYTNTLKFNTLNIEYTAWYNRDTTNNIPWTWDEMPEDIKLMQMLLVGWYYNKRKWVWIKTYRLWEEAVTFWWWDEDQFDSFKVLYNLYKKIDVLQ